MWSDTHSFEEIQDMLQKVERDKPGTFHSGVKMINTAFLLNILANKLETVEDKNFRMTGYFNGDGTPSCALGWATKIPEWNKVGLHEYHYGVRMEGYENRGLFVGLRNKLKLTDSEIRIFWSYNSSRADVIRQLREAAEKRSNLEVNLNSEVSGK